MVHVFLYLANMKTHIKLNSAKPSRSIERAQGSIILLPCQFCLTPPLQTLETSRPNTALGGMLLTTLYITWWISSHYQGLFGCTLYTVLRKSQNEVSRTINASLQKKKYRLVRIIRGYKVLPLSSRYK